ncbi:MAG: hypothetical protein AB1792_12070 [Candidatus Zixiibacteriota bacterium]
MPDYRNGDVLVTYGTGGIWPPRRLVLWLVYQAIRAYQKVKWGERSDFGPTHVRVWIAGRFFEMTTPVGQWTDLATLKLDKKRWKVGRYRHQSATGLDADAMRATADAMVGNPYDRGDLLDFALAGLVGFFARILRIFGDRRHKYRVCSTAAAKVLVAGGAQMRISHADLLPDAAINADLTADESILPDDVIDPAYFVNNRSHWEIVSLRM